MKRNRQAKILELIERMNIETQEQLLQELEACGFTATQATISRDIKELNLVKAITEDGKKTQLMTEEQPSNGVKGYNGYAINVAWMGGISNTGKPIDNRTDAQKQTLRELLTELKHRYPDAKILGHRDISPDKNHNGVVDPWERIKECPCFDAITEYADIK